MEKACSECCQAIVGIDQVACRGYCGGIFHMTCAGVSRALLSYFTSHKKNLFWMCVKCAEMFENSHFRSISCCSHEPSPLASLSEAINELRTEIKQLSTKPATLPAPPALPRPEPRPPQAPKARYMANTAAQYGSKESSQNIVTVQNSTVGNDKFWLYLSRIRPDATNELISAIVKECLETTVDPEVVKLVPKGKDTAGLSFISFKIGLDQDLKTTALDPSTWPEGIMFREFEDYGSKNFRKPSED